MMARDGLSFNFYGKLDEGDIFRALKTSTSSRG
jgi:hypothetical protein